MGSFLPCQLVNLHFPRCLTPSMTHLLSDRISTRSTSKSNTRTTANNFARLSVCPPHAQRCGKVERAPLCPKPANPSLQLCPVVIVSTRAIRDDDCLPPLLLHPSHGSISSWYGQRRLASSTFRLGRPTNDCKLLLHDAFVSHTPPHLGA